MWLPVVEPGQRWWLLRSATVGSPSGSPAHPNAPRGRTPARHVPGISPSDRCVRGTFSTVLCHRILAGTPAQGASITSTTTRPWPCAIQPTTRAPRQLVARLNIKHQSIWGASHAHQMEALQTDEQITPIKRHTAAGRARHRPRSLKTAGVEVRSSPGTSTSTRNPRSTPTHPHSTRKSQFDRGPGSARGRLRHVRARGAAPEDERIKRDGQGPARPGRPAPRTHAPRPRGGGGARRGACAPRSRHPCVT